jgi:hypothetical protein
MLNENVQRHPLFCRKMSRHDSLLPPNSYSLNGPNPRRLHTVNVQIPEDDLPRMAKSRR